MTSDLHRFAAFGPQQLLFDRERSTGSVAPRSRNQKRDPFTQEQREDDPRVEKRACLNKEKQLERPSGEFGLISEGDILIGEKNKLTVQRSVQFELQYQNGSNSRLGGALEIIVAELPRLVEQKQLQDAQIKELKEALDYAEAEIREAKEARVAAEQKISALTEEHISLLNEKLGWEDEAKRLGKEKLDWMAKTAQLMREKDALVRERDSHREEIICQELNCCGWEPLGILTKSNAKRQEIRKRGSSGKERMILIYVWKMGPRRWAGTGIIMGSITFCLCEWGLRSVPLVKLTKWKCR